MTNIELKDRLMTAAQQLNQSLGEFQQMIDLCERHVLEELAQHHQAQRRMPRSRPHRDPLALPA